MLKVVLDKAFFFTGIAAEAAVVGLLVFKRAWRTLPVFMIYVAWGMTEDLGSYIFQRHSVGLSSHRYLISYLIAQIVDSVLQFSVLIELAWSILRPLRSRLSSRALMLVALFILALGAAIWPFASIHGAAHLPPAWQNIIHLQQTTPVLRVLFFVLLAGCSQLLSIGWRDRELQIATGLDRKSVV